jgi:heavy metal sensor kinase
MAIRTRLTIWYTAVLALILLLFGAGVYGVVSVLMLQQVDSSLRNAADAAPLVFRRSLPFEREGKRVIAIPQLDLFRASEMYVQVTDKDGSIIGMSSNMINYPFEDHLDPVAHQQASQLPPDKRGDIVSETRHADSPPILVLTRRITDEKHDVLGYLQVAMSLETVHAAQNSLLIALVSLGLIGVVLSAVIGALLARRALRPVDEITRTAMAIYRAENLDQRVAVPKTRDEVGRLSLAFNEMLDRLSKLFNAQQRLVADVSHEMRTPLTVIRGNVDLLRWRGCADQESIDALSREADRMTRLVGDLLLLSQADAGVLSMNIQPTPLAPLLVDVERSADVLAGHRVNVTTQVEDGLVLAADPDRIKQVLLNLIDNAIKHTPDGGKVTIEANRSYSGFARIAVSDTGVGIQESELPQVFERFYRVDKSRSRANGGSGLGLSIAASIVQAHNGRITVSSKVGEGTTFDVYLPLYEHQPQQLASAN